MRDLKELTGYDIITEEKIPEVNGTGYILSHKKTKARVLVIANDDENKVFNIGFRTPPYDDSGITHICPLYASDAADDQRRVAPGGCRRLKKTASPYLQTVKSANELLPADGCTKNEPQTL